MYPMDQATQPSVQTSMPSVETGPPANATVAAARIVRRLRNAVDWRKEMDEALEMLGRAIGCHRAILFRLRELPGQGLTQSAAAYWFDTTIEGNDGPPTVIMQS